METTILGLYEIDLGRGLVLTSNLTFHARMSLLRILAGEGAITEKTLAEEMKAILLRLDTAFGELVHVHRVQQIRPRSGRSICRFFL